MGAGENVRHCVDVYGVCYEFVWRQMSFAYELWRTVANGSSQIQTHALVRRLTQMMKVELISPTYISMVHLGFTNAHDRNATKNNDHSAWAIRIRGIEPRAIACRWDSYDPTVERR